MTEIHDPLALPPDGERFNFPACEIVFRGFLALEPAAQVEFAHQERAQRELIDRILADEPDWPN